jgi:hypothetical protein
LRERALRLEALDELPRRRQLLGLRRVALALAAVRIAALAHARSCTPGATAAAAGP